MKIQKDNTGVIDMSIEVKDFRKSNNLIQAKFSQMNKKKEFKEWTATHYKIVDLLLMTFETNQDKLQNLFDCGIRIKYSNMRQILNLERCDYIKNLRTYLQDISNTGFAYINQDKQYTYTRFIYKFKDNYDQKAIGKTQDFECFLNIDKELYTELIELYKRGNFTILSGNQFKLKYKWDICLYQFLKMKLGLKKVDHTGKIKTKDNDFIDKIDLSINDLNDLFKPKTPIKHISLFKKNLENSYKNLVKEKFIDDIFHFEYSKTKLTIKIDR